MSTRVAICLFEDTITDFDLKLMGGNPLTEVRLDRQIKDAELYVKASSEAIPEWTNVISSFANIRPADFSTASSGAILFLKIDGKILACCFGTSVANVNREFITRDFGLAVAFNDIPLSRYKGIETFTLTENPVTNARHAARPSTQATFNLDSYLETITQLSGNLTVNSKTTLVKGKEFFSVTVPDSLSEICKLCAELLASYTAAIANPKFKELTSVSKVKAKSLIDFLNNNLCSLLDKKSGKAHLIDYQFYDNISSYGLTPSGNKISELDVNDLYGGLHKRQKFSLQYLKNRRVTVFDADDQELDNWPLYKCLYTLITLNTGTYILYKGSWYEVQKRYLNDLREYIRKHELQSSTINLPYWNGTDDEGNYNKVAAKSVNGQCWDKVLYTHPDFSYGIEFCDILFPGRVVHVKKHSSSSLNSHLLMQTYVSAQLLNTDLAIRPWITNESKKRFRKNIFLTRKNDYKEPPIKYTITLMRADKVKAVADTLPFFSLITFNFMIRKIMELGFEVEICVV